MLQLMQVIVLFIAFFRKESDMKRILLTYLPAAACMLMLTACSGRSEEAMPAVSPNLDMRTAHVFSNDTGLCDVTVDEVFEGT